MAVKTEIGGIMMCYYDEDFYYEPSEFEQKLDELKEALVLSVKEDILEELKELREENETLRDFKENKEKYLKELEKTKKDCARKIQEAEKNAKKLRAKELMEYLSITGYRPNVQYFKKPKCDKCDKNRKISYITPLGREAKESCTCDVSIAKYTPKEVVMIEFTVNNGIEKVYYERDDYYEEYDRYSTVADVYNDCNFDFEKINEYRAVFLKKEDCQKYCEWLERKRNNEI